jgi:hypothetical protein
MAAAKKSLIGFLALLGEISLPDHSKLTRIFYEKRRPSLDVTFDEKVEPDTYLKLEDLNEEIHQKVQAMLAPPGVHGIVCFECMDMCSSSMGERKALIFGPDCTYKTLDAVLWYDKERKIPNKLDTHLASTQKWPVAFFVKPEVEAEHLKPEADHADSTAG